jgi:hypothetical protein
VVNGKSFLLRLFCGTPKLRKSFLLVGLQNGGPDMGRGILLWLIGIPIPIILLIWLLGGLHG